MLKFSANLSWLYTEIPLTDRFQAASADGFDAVEMLFPYVLPAQQIKDLLDESGVKCVLFNAPPGGTDEASFDLSWKSGMRGLACLEGREDEFKVGLNHALRYAEILECPRIHVMSGCLTADGPDDSANCTMIKNLRYAADLAASQGREILIEPINTRDFPGYFLTKQQQAHTLLAEVDRPNLKVQMDLYHCQIMEGDIEAKLRCYLPQNSIGHLQIASVPFRTEPDTGELNYSYIFDLLDQLGYEHWIGCEYRPKYGDVSGATSNGLSWLKRRRPNELFR